jgi:hypothetical protein
MLKSGYFLLKNPVLERFHFSSSVLGAMPTAAVGMFFRENNGMATLRGHGTRYTGTETALAMPPYVGKLLAATSKTPQRPLEKTPQKSHSGYLIKSLQVVNSTHLICGISAQINLILKILVGFLPIS